MGDPAIPEGLLGDATTPRLLLADDDDLTARVAALGLRRGGFEVTTVGDGAAALDAARAGGFDAIVLDWDLPAMSGVDICRALHGDPTWTPVPIVFLTGMQHEGAEDEALAAGARGVITKPFDPRTIGERVRAHLDASA